MPAKSNAISSLKGVQQNADSAASLLKSMANTHRLMVLCVLAGKEMSVSEINACVELSQSALSQHLARLRADDLVITRRDSQTIYYSLADGPAMEIIHILQQFYCHY